MTVKRPSWLPNERVDVVDQTHGTVDFPVSLLEQAANRLVKDRYSRVSNGFRVEIADQTLNPGFFTVINGVALDQSGKVVSNEEETNASRSFTFSADATYYVEIEFITNPTDTDARGFWDPSFDNGTDTSGDILPDGKEFSQNVATRLLHDWQISTPISTTGFAVEADADSLKIPIAILTVSGGEITGVTTSAASSCVAQTVTAGDSSFRIFDSRILPDTFDIEVGVGLGTAEVVTVADNDRENGILTLSGTFTNNHAIGERTIEDAVAPTQYLDERVVHDPVLESSAGDARQLFWQGNEEVGYGLSRDPYATGANDIQIKQLKDYVDFISAQIREIKWGSGRSTEVGDLAPPSSFTATPHYYEFAGSLAGARAHTVSVGNGTTSFGDFNSTQTGSAQAALTAAIAALPSDGGIVYVKAGTYSVTTTVTVNKPVVMIGDGIGSTIIRTTAAVPALTVNTGGGFFCIENLSLEATSTVVALDFNNTVAMRVSAKNCIIHGVTCSSTGDLSKSKFELCDFSAAATLTSGIAFSGELNDVVFDRCNFASSAAIAGARGVSLEANSTNVTFKECTIASNSSGTSIVTLDGATANTIEFNNCLFSGAGSNNVFGSVAAGSQHIRLINCKSTATNGLGTFLETSKLQIRGCYIEFGSNQVGINVNGREILIDGCVFKQTANAAGAGGKAIAIVAASAGTGLKSSRISNCTFGGLFGDTNNRVDFGIYFNTTTDVFYNTISNSHFNHARSAIFIDSSVDTYQINIQGCEFEGLALGHDTIIAHLQSESNLFNFTIEGCAFGTSDGLTNADEAYGILLSGSSGNDNITDSTITGCVFDGIFGDSISRAIDARGLSNSSITGCNFIAIASNASSGDTWDGINIGGMFNSAISGNVFSGLGNASLGLSGNAAISLGADDSNGQGVVISGNTFLAIAADVSVYGILINNHHSDISITGNNMILVDQNVTAIWCQSISGSAPDMLNITISGNNISGSYLSGIIADFRDPLDPEGEGNWVVSGNNITNFSSFGIAIGGGTAVNLVQNAIITGNNLKVISGSGQTAISVDKVDILNVSNNVINMVGPIGDLIGIVIDESEIGTVCGNVVRIEEDTGNCTGIKTDGANTASRLCISGNMVYVSNASAGTIGIFLGSNCFAAANYVDVDGAQPEIDRTGATNAHTATFNNSGAQQNVTAGAVELNLNKAVITP